MFSLMAGGNRFHSVIKTHKWVVLGVSGGLGFTAPSVTLGLWLLCVLWNRGTVLSLAFSFLAFSVSRGSALCRVDMLILCHKREGKDERCQQISSIFLSPTILLPPCSAFACCFTRVCAWVPLCQGFSVYTTRACSMHFKANKIFTIIMHIPSTWFTSQNLINSLCSFPVLFHWNRNSISVTLRNSIILHWHDVTAQNIC